MTPFEEVAIGRRAVLAINGHAIGRRPKFYALSYATMQGQTISNKVCMVANLTGCVQEVELILSMAYTLCPPNTTERGLFPKFRNSLKKRLISSPIVVTDLCDTIKGNLASKVFGSAIHGYVLDPIPIYDLKTMVAMANFDAGRVRFEGDPCHPMAQSIYWARLAMGSIRSLYDVERPKPKILLPQVEVKALPAPKPHLPLQQPPVFEVSPIDRVVDDIFFGDSDGEEVQGR